jgi:hypothetical protein
MQTVTNCSCCCSITAATATFSQPEDTFYLVKEYDDPIAAMMTNERRHREIPLNIQSLSSTELQENLVDSVFEQYKYKNALSLVKW